MPKLQVEIIVLGAKDLPQVGTEKCDPFVTIKLRDGYEHKTEEKNNTLNPEWNAKFIIDKVENPATDMIKLTVFDAVDRISYMKLKGHNVLGVCFLQLDLLPMETSVDMWLPININKERLHPKNSLLHINVRAIGFGIDPDLHFAYKKVHEEMSFFSMLRDPLLQSVVCLESMSVYHGLKQAYEKESERDNPSKITLLVFPGKYLVFEPIVLSPLKHDAKLKLVIIGIGEDSMPEVEAYDPQDFIFRIEKGVKKSVSLIFSNINMGVGSKLLYTAPTIAPIIHSNFCQFGSVWSVDKSNTPINVTLKKEVVTDGANLALADISASNFYILFTSEYDLKL